jgi:hypothetical protein
MSAEFDTQSALYTALTALGLRVYDSAPQVADGGAVAVFPYVEVGAIILAYWDTKSEAGFDVAIRIHTRSRSGSMKEAKDIQGQIYDRLHRGALVVTGYGTIDLYRETSDVMRASDNSFHGVCEYRGMLEKTA